MPCNGNALQCLAMPCYAFLACCMYLLCFVILCEFARLDALLAEVLSNMIKQKRKEKAGKWQVPIPKAGNSFCCCTCACDILQHLATSCNILQHFATSSAGEGNDRGRDVQDPSIGQAQEEGRSEKPRVNHGHPLFAFRLLLGLETRREQSLLCW